MADPKKAVAVLGSLNIDIVTVTSRLAEGGETLTASSISTGFGGKGANQAVACGRLAAPNVRTMMIGNVGGDSFGTDYKEKLAQEGIDASGVNVCPDEATGMAAITVEEKTGENRIYVATNANHTKKDQPSSRMPGDATVAVFQLELPLAEVMRGIEAARSNGSYVVLNPAPAVDLPRELYQHVDCIVLNETEADILCGASHSWSKDFFEYGVRDLVILTRGSQGVQWISRHSADSGIEQLPAHKVKVVDTTAAGDTFVGALAARIAAKGASGSAVRDDIAFANHAAALTVTKAGAMAAIPTLIEVESWVNAG